MISEDDFERVVSYKARAMVAEQYLEECERITKEIHEFMDDNDVPRPNDSKSCSSLSARVKYLVSYIEYLQRESGAADSHP